MTDYLDPVPSKNKKYCVKLNHSCCNKFKFNQILNHYVLSMEAISVLHMEEKMILIDTRTFQSIRDISGCCITTKKTNQFWYKLSDCNLKHKSCES